MVSICFPERDNKIGGSPPNRFLRRGDVQVPRPMRIRFLKAAQKGFDDAVAWYDEREEDLGRDFLDELDRVIRYR